MTRIGFLNALKAHPVFSPFFTDNVAAHVWILKNPAKWFGGWSQEDVIELRNFESFTAAVGEGVAQARLETLPSGQQGAYIYVELSARKKALGFRQMKSFTVGEAISPERAAKSYFLPPDVVGLVDRVGKGEFFMLYGPRGSGKTTTACHLLNELVLDHGVTCLRADFDSLSLTKTEFWNDLNLQLSDEAKYCGMALERFSSAETFCTAFTKAKLGGVSAALMLDECDALNDAEPELRAEVLGALRTIKLDKHLYALQCIVAVGRLSVLWLAGEPDSPFSITEAVPAAFFTGEQVAQLLEQFSTTCGRVLENGVAADIHAFTKGHAGLVCCCGVALESAPELQSLLVSLAQWRAFRVQHILAYACGWSTIGSMAPSIAKQKPEVKHLLELSIIAGEAPLDLESASEEVRARAVVLATEGWLMPDGLRMIFHFTSPLIRDLALDQIPMGRGPPMQQKLPLLGESLDMLAVVKTILPLFSRENMTHRVGAKWPTRAAYH